MSVVCNEKYEYIIENGYLHCRLYKCKYNLNFIFESNKN